MISEELRTEAVDVPWKSWCGIRDMTAISTNNSFKERIWIRFIKSIDS